MELDKAQDMERRILHRILWPAVVILAGAALVNVMTLATEAQRAGLAFDVVSAAVLEFTSVSVLLALVPAVAALVRRVPFSPGRWYAGLPIYLGASVVFSAAHVLGMVVLRVFIFWAFWRQTYVFFEAPVTDLLYEYRKDLLPFAVIVTVCHLARRLEENRQEVMSARTEAQTGGRLMLKSGSRTLWVDAAAFEWASAAGNYVELHVRGASHLVRMTLASLEILLQQEGVAIVRVHRSRIVNGSKVREVVPTRDGDFVVRLFDGAEVRGSRRYREHLTGGTVG